jgi:UDP-sugar transporter A1/2/3
MSSGMFAREQAPYTITASVLMCLQPMLVTMSKDDAGGFSYSVPWSTMLSEALKLAISAALLALSLCRGQIGSFLNDQPLSEFLSYMLPAAIYFVNNNCIFYILLSVDPTTFQLLSQMKTIFTGLLFRVFLKRKLSAVQYLALVTLACGTACSQLPSGRHGPKGPKGGSPLLGAALSVLSSLLSALGGIYNEKLLKGRPAASIHWQNIQMYVWGVAFNGLGAYMKDGRAFLEHGSLAGFTAAAWAVVLCNALNGLAISAVLKYADNIARVYAHAIAMMMTMVLSTRLFHTPVTPQLVLAVTLVATSTLQYNLPKELLRVDEEESALTERSKLIAESMASTDESETEAAGASSVMQKRLKPVA